ncbi:MAG: hypothetical protein KC503_11930, partial [Myxococcales bacterium]|nr:hypothetical protein [Myxococcales bacterium]
MSNAARVLLLFGAAALVASGCKKNGAGARGGGAGGGKGAARAPGSYDVKPLLGALRPSQRAGQAKRLGIASLGDLPLYDIALVLDPAAGALRGRLKLSYRNPLAKPLARLPLLLHPNAPRELGVTQSGKLDVTGARAQIGPAVTLSRERPTLVWLSFARPLRAGERVVVDIDFRGTLRRLEASANDIFSQALTSLGIGGGGSGASDYGLLAVGDGIVTAASAYPMVAPFRRGGFDVGKPTRFGDLAYNGLANFKVNVSVPAGVKVYTNLHDINLDRAPAALAAKPGQQGARQRFSASGALNRDLVIVAGAELVHSARVVRGSGSGGGEPVTVRSIYKRGDAAAGRRALQTAVTSLELFQRRFGPYPYRELDVAEATLVGGAGGVEFPGLVLVAGMFYRPPSRSSSPMAFMMRLLGQLGSLLGRGMH